MTWPLDAGAHRGRVGARGGALGPAPPDPSVRPLAADRRAGAWPAGSAVSAGALERFAGCPVKWLVEDVLKPEKLEPDPEQMVRGSYAHRVLELTFRRLREHTGVAPRDPANLPEAERILLEALRPSAGRVSPVARPDPRAGGGPEAGVRPAALPAPRVRSRRRRSSPSTWSCASGSRTPTTRRSSWRAACGCAG